MHLIKHMTHVSERSKENWVGPRFCGLYFSSNPWVVVERPLTHAECIVSCHATYEEAKLALLQLEGPGRSKRSHQSSSHQSS